MKRSVGLLVGFSVSICLRLRVREHALLYSENYAYGRSMNWQRVKVQGIVRLRGSF